MRALGHALATGAGLYELFRLAVLSRFRMRGKYWTWRMHTALGDGAGVSPAERRRAILEYGRWVARMRRP
ncbi:MAG TPA: hypothetical protein VD971_00630 [Phycisphaerales bacterium]|nr:hypothetical protein [Phycisphaerales bacterium]